MSSTLALHARNRDSQGSRAGARRDGGKAPARRRRSHSGTTFPRVRHCARGSHEKSSQYGAHSRRLFERLGRRGIGAHGSARRGYETVVQLSGVDLLGYSTQAQKGAISTAGAMTLSPQLESRRPMARSIDDLRLAYLRCAILAQQAETSDLESESPGTCWLVEGPLRDCIEPASREALDRARSTFEANGIPVKETALPNSFKTM